MRKIRYTQTGRLLLLTDEPLFKPWMFRDTLAFFFVILAYGVIPWAVLLSLAYGVYQLVTLINSLVR